MSEKKQHDGKLDLLTVFAIAIIAYIAANVLHEGVGHAGVCVMVGCQPLILTTAHVDWQIGSASDTGARLIAAGGTLVNLVAAVVFWLLLRNVHRAGGSLRYFFWISMVVNLLIGTGYFLFSGVIGIGDWINVIDGWEPAALWRGLLIGAGIVLYLGAIAFSIQSLAPLVGANKPEALRRAVRLTTLPYVVGSIASTLGSLLNPEGMILFAISAAAHFGGTSGLAWMAQMLRTKMVSAGQHHADFHPSPVGMDCHCNPIAGSSHRHPWPGYSFQLSIRNHEFGFRVTQVRLLRVGSIWYN